MKKARGKKKRETKPADYRVFVSHATSDKWIAMTLCERLDSIAGISTFRDDRDIKAGDDISDEIRREIVRSDELVLLLTPDSVHRPWVLFEAGAFWGRQRNGRIIAVLCHVTLDTIPDLIRAKRMISINEFDDYIAELTGRI